MPRRTGRLLSGDIARVRIIRKLGIQTFRGDKFYYGKMYVRPGAYLFPGLHGAQRVFLKRVTRHGGDGSWSTRWNYQVARKEIQIRDELRALGLPVPKAGVIQIKSGKNAGVYIAISPFLHGKGSEMKSRLQPINSRQSEPDFLRKLDVVRDRQVIKGLARATAAMYNHGIGAWYFDFIGFYPKKNGSWGFVFMDTEELYHWPGPKQDEHSIPNLLAQVHRGFGNTWLRDAYTGDITSWGLFHDEFNKHLHPELKP